MVDASYYIGHATNHDIRFKASSGGIGTIITRYLLSQPEYGTSITFIFDKTKCLWTPKLIHSVDEINICGSIYQDIDIFGFIHKHISEIKDGIVLTVAPCQVAGVRKLLDDRRINNFILSFCCSGQTTVEGTWKYYEFLGIKKADISTMQYRGNGWPSGIQIKLGNGSEIFRNNYSEPWKTIHCSSLFRPKRCFYCRRDTGRDADIALADPWLEKYMTNDKVGNTLFVVLTRKGTTVFETLLNEKIIKSVPTDYTSYAIAQKANVQKGLNIDEQRWYLYCLSKLTANAWYRNWATKTQKNMKRHIMIMYFLKRVLIYAKKCSQVFQK